jgi:hypothetical protein
MLLKTILAVSSTAAALTGAIIMGSPSFAQEFSPASSDAPVATASTAASTVSIWRDDDGSDDNISYWWPDVLVPLDVCGVKACYEKGESGIA